jgi:hypothetical protein
LILFFIAHKNNYKDVLVMDEVIDGYKWLYTDKLDNGLYRTKISYYLTHAVYSLRTLEKPKSLQELLKIIETKYGQELCMLNDDYIIELL